MADSTIRRGRDTFVTDATAGNPNAPHAQAETLKLQASHSKVYVYLPTPGVRGRTIGQATLTCPVKDTWAAQTITATPLNKDWTPRETTWNNQPTVRTAQAIAAAQGAKSDGDRIEIDVTSHIQSIADGAQHWGWEIKTSSSTPNRLYAFDSPDHGSWVLSIDFTEAPEAPTDLAPNGTVTAVEPVLTFDFIDLGGESTELASVRVQVNTSATSSGAWDSGHIDAVVPEFDLAASAWPTTPTSGTTYYWRVFVKDGAGYESDPSDWASFIYVPKPTLTVDNPATGIAWDPTPTVAAHISAGTIKAWRIRIARGSDKSKILYDSGRQKGTGSSSLAHTIPFRDDRKRRILKDDSNYWVNIRVWDRNDRQPTPGDPAWVQQWVLFHLDDDATPPPPTSLTATQIGDTPRVQLQWVRSTGFPEGWVIRRDGEVVARLDPDEVDVDEDTDTYTWIDNGAAPFLEHSWSVKVIDGSKQSAASNVAHATPHVVGTWLLNDTSAVQLDGVDLTGLKLTEKRATYSPLNTPYDVDIVYALGGVNGTYSGTLSTSRGRDVDAMLATLMAMRDEPGEQVQFVYAEKSVPVELRNVTSLPSSTYQPGSRRHDVVFEVQQIDNFDGTA